MSDLDATLYRVEAWAEAWRDDWPQTAASAQRLALESRLTMARCAAVFTRGDA